MPSDTASQEAKVRLWGVMDTNATAVDNDGKPIPRVHEIIGARGQIHRYKLVNDEPLPMPENHARQFLKDRAFIVVDHRQRTVAPMEPEQQERIAPSRLAPQFCIANLNELTDEALLTRAGVRPGFDRLPDRPERTVLIDFIQGQMQELEPDDEDDDDRIEGEGAGGARVATELLGGGE
jgi:hypothetical protein